MRQVPNANRRLEDHVLRALNKIRKPSTAEEITELLNRDLGPGERPFSDEGSCKLLGRQVTRYSDCTGWKLVPAGSPRHWKVE